MEFRNLQRTHRDDPSTRAPVLGRPSSFPVTLLAPILLLIGTLLYATNAESRPENVRAGMSYYSDDYVVQGLVRDIADEKNYEEVYQFYTYYEVVYDEAGRVVKFVEYRRGEMRRRETYDYEEDGTLGKRTIERPGKEPEVTVVDPE